MVARLKHYALIMTLLASCSFKSIDSIIDPVTPLIIGGVLVVSVVAVGSSLSTLALVKFFGPQDQHLPSWAKNLSDEDQKTIAQARSIEIAFDSLLSESINIQQHSLEQQSLFFFNVAKYLIESNQLELKFSAHSDEFLYFSYALVESYIHSQIELSQECIDQLLVLREKSELSASEYIYAIVKDLKDARNRLKKVRSLVLNLPEYKLHKGMFELLNVLYVCSTKDIAIEDLDITFYRSVARGLSVTGEGWLERLRELVDGVRKNFESLSEHAHFCYEKYQDTPMACCYFYIESLPEHGETLEAIVKRLQEL